MVRNFKNTAKFTELKGRKFVVNTMTLMYKPGDVVPFVSRGDRCQGIVLRKLNDIWYCKMLNLITFNKCFKVTSENSLTTRYVIKMYK